MSDYVEVEWILSFNGKKYYNMELGKTHYTHYVELIPCVRKSDGQRGNYDTLRKMFCYMDKNGKYVEEYVE